MAERPDRPSSKDRTQVIPEPARPDLFEFLEKLFDGSENQPDKIELRQAYGPGASKYRKLVIQKDYKPNSAKPSREFLVGLSNELLNIAQNDCNEVGKPQKYGILSKCFKKSNEYYGCFTVSLKPTQPAMDGDEHGTSDDDEDPVAGDRRRANALLDHSLGHMKQSDENERWRQEQFSSATGDLLEKYQNLLQITMQQNLEMQKEHRELYKLADDALSRKADRELAAEMQKFKIGMMENGFQFLQQMAPVVVNRLNGKEASAGEASAESIAIQTFLKGLTNEQGAALFGEIVDGKPQGGGVFTNDQVGIFWRVANLTDPPSALDQLFAGPTAISEEQIVKAQTVVSMQQFGPLFALFINRQKKQLESGAQASA